MWQASGARQQQQRRRRQQRGHSAILNLVEMRGSIEMRGSRGGGGAARGRQRRRLLQDTGIYVSTADRCRRGNHWPSTPAQPAPEQLDPARHLLPLLVCSGDLGGGRRYLHNHLCARQAAVVFVGPARLLCHQRQTLREATARCARTYVWWPGVNWVMVKSKQCESNLPSRQKSSRVPATYGFKQHLQLRRPESAVPWWWGGLLACTGRYAPCRPWRQRCLTSHMMCTCMSD